MDNFSHHLGNQEDLLLLHPGIYASHNGMSRQLHMSRQQPVSFFVMQAVHEAGVACLGVGIVRICCLHG